MIETLPLYYDGKTQAAPAGVEHLTLKAPATGEPYAQVPLCGADTVDHVVRSALAAFPGWRETPVVERARVLFRYRQILEGEADALARRARPGRATSPPGCSAVAAGPAVRKKPAARPVPAVTVTAPAPAPAEH